VKYEAPELQFVADISETHTLCQIKEVKSAVNANFYLLGTVIL